MKIIDRIRKRLGEGFARMAEYPITELSMDVDESDPDVQYLIHNLFDSLKIKREGDNTMAQPKKSVKFTVADGVKPRASVGPSHLINLFAPLELQLQEGRDFLVDFGLTCSHPLLLTASSAVSPMTGGTIIAAGTPVKAALVAKITAPLARGELVISAIPLGLAEFEIG
jgi:hypothetical protein